MLVAQKLVPVALALLWGATAVRAEINLFTNPGLDQITDPKQGEGLLPPFWLNYKGLPSTFSIDGSFGLPFSFLELYGGAKPVSGKNIVGLRAKRGDAMIQKIDNEKDWIPGRRYRVEGFVLGAKPTPYKNPARIVFFILGPGGTPFPLVKFAPTLPFSENWQYRWGTFTLPSFKGGTGEVGFYAETDSGDANPGLDNLFLTPADTPISGSFNPIGGGVNLKGWNYDVEVRMPGSTAPSDSILGSVGNSGTFSTLTAAPDGTYDLAFKPDRCLRRVIPNVVVPDTGVNGLRISVIVGDIDGDNYIGSDDYLDLTASFDKNPGDVGYNPMADLSGDGYVGTDDYIILNRNFDRHGDD